MDRSPSFVSESVASLVAPCPMPRLDEVSRRVHVGKLRQLSLLSAVFLLVAVGGTSELAVAQEAVIALDTINASASTGEKPQSKVWQHAGTWWAVLPTTSMSPNGTWIWRLELDDSWTNVVNISSSTDSKADVKVVGDVVHILLYDGNPELVSVEYQAATDSYVAWPTRPTRTSISLPDSEIATIDVDSTGRMWLATEDNATDEVVVYYSDSPYSTFTGPITLATDIANDDITVVAAIPNPSQDADTIGVLWSNQRAEQFGFRVHVDGTDPSAAFWLADEVPAADGFADGVADDHLNVAVGSDGTLYAAVKTSFDTAGHPKIALLVRRLDAGGPEGIWENQTQTEEVYGVDESGTRGIVLLNEYAGTVRVVYTAVSGGDDIVYRESPTSVINFGPTQTLMSGTLNDATSTKATWTDEVVILASGSSVQCVLILSNLSTTTTSTTTSTTTTTLAPTTTTTLAPTTTTTTLAPTTTTTLPPTTTTTSPPTTTTTLPQECIADGEGAPCAASTNCCSGVGNCTGGKPSNRLCGPTPSVCGDGVVEGDEQCEAGVPLADSCESLGFADGVLACDANCQYDTSGCTGGSCAAYKDPCSVDADCCSLNCKRGACGK